MNEIDENCVEKPDMADEEIDENLEDTFPASDPPSWTLGTDHGKKCPDGAEHKDELT
jgi:hypothetical protein